MKYEIMDEARADLRDIYVHGVDNWGVAKADEYQDAILKGINFIAENPSMVIPVEDDIFKYPVKSHNIIGRFVGETFEVMQVVRVLHGHAMPINHIH